MTTTRLGLDRRELLSTLLAVIVSSTFWVAFGHPYLARGVLGDLVGLAALTLVLLARRRRARHEALACLAAIGLVAAQTPAWPLRIPDLVWWTLVAGAVAGYVCIRQRVLTDRRAVGPLPPS